MAQRTEKEEMEFNAVPETIALCVKCGVAGISVANNSCQKCFNAVAAVSTSASSAASPTSTDRFFVGDSSRSSSFSSSSLNREADPRANPEAKDLAEAALRLKRQVNRCSGCRRKIGLTGFRCRCGELFCSDHRYSDRHECSFDYKTFGRAAIARENPVVKAAKIVKI